MTVGHLLLIAALQQASPETVVVQPAMVNIEVDSSVRFRAEVRDADGAIIEDAAHTLDPPERRSRDDRHDERNRDGPAAGGPLLCLWYPAAKWDGQR